MSTLTVQLVYICVVTLLTIGIYKQWGYQMTLVGLGFMILPSCFSLSVISLSLTVMLFIATVICNQKKTGSMRYLQVCIGVSGFVIGIMVIQRITMMNYADELRQQHPMESMVQRLNYESKHPVDQKTTFPPETTNELEQFQYLLEETLEKNYSYQARNRALEYIHASAVSRFADAPGFGVGRMVRRTRLSSLNEASGPEKEFDLTDQYLNRDTKTPLQALEPRDTPDSEVLRNYHQQNSLNFVFPEGFGYIKDREHVAKCLWISFLIYWPKAHVAASFQDALGKIEFRRDSISIVKAFQ